MAGIFIASGVLTAIGIGLLFARRSKKDKLLELKFTQTATAKELHDLCNSVAAELGNAGGFSQMTEVKGIIECDAPLTSELAKHPCVYYAMTVEERYEETVTEKDSQGREVRRTRTATSTVASNTQRTEFKVRDQTGTMTIDPTHADMDGVQILSKYEPAPSKGGFSFGSFALNASERKVLGYQLTETTIPLNRRTYVIGEATDRSGRLLIQKPADKEKPFIVTLKSEEELTRSTESTIKGLAIGAIACFVIAAAVLVFSIVKP